MTLERYWTILIKQWKLVTICFVVVGVGAYVGSKLMTPLYQSSVLVEVSVRSGNNQTADYNNLLASDQLVQTESQLAVSDPVLREVASRYRWLTVGVLQGEVSSTVKVNTQLFEIDVVNPSPTQAAALANDVAATLIKQQTQQTQQDNNGSQQQIQVQLSDAQQQIDDTTQQIATATNQIATWQEQVAGLQAQTGRQAQIAALQTQITTSQAHLAALQTQLNRLQDRYNQWETALAQLELAEAQSGNFLRIAQPGQSNPTPVRPQVLLNTAGGFAAGLLLGVLLALLFEQLDTRVRTSEALTQIFDWPLLATIWRVDSKKEDVVNPKEHGTNVESFRILRTNIGFAEIDKPLHSILVTSAVPHEGKSTVASNLAVFMAKAGKRTLLIDADLRRPTLHEKFQIPLDKPGLSNAIVAFSQRNQFASAVSLPGQFGSLRSVGFSLDPYMHSVGVPNLLVMPSGPLPPNPPDLLDSKAIEGLFEMIQKFGAEIVILDTPPLLGLSDTSILMPKVDGAIVVIDVTHAHKKNLKQAKEILAKSGSHILGCVINKDRHSRKDSAYSYYYYYRSVEQNGEDKPAKNGHAPAVPLNSLPPVNAHSSQLEQRMRSN